MIRTTFRRGLAIGLLAGAVLTVLRTVRGRRTESLPTPSWEPIPDASPLVVPEPAVDVEVAPGPAPRPDRPATRDLAAVNSLQEAPAPPAPSEVESEPVAPWVEPVADECPGTHPIKGKLSSRIFHVPGGFNYPRTKPDRCYVDAAAAEADGLRASKR